MDAEATLANERTVYEVSTLYTLDDRGVTSTREVERATERVVRHMDRSARSASTLERSFQRAGLSMQAFSAPSRMLLLRRGLGTDGSYARGIDRVNRSLGEMPRRADRAARSMSALNSAVSRIGTIAVFGASAAAAGTAYLGFRNLNEEVTRTNQLAAQFNLAFKFDDDPVKNYLVSMRESRKLTGDIIRDAARLPGESRNFFNTAGLLAGPLFTSGRGAEDVRRMTAQIALAAPFAGQRQEDAGRQAFRIISGQAGMENPLFAQLLTAQLLPGARVLNRMNVVERIEALDNALAKLVDNPAFRENVLNTLETQWGTLMDTVFGSRGIFGQTVGMEGYDALVEAIKVTASTLDKYAPAISGAFMILGEGIRELWSMLPGDWTSSLFDARALAQRGEEIRAERIARRLMPDYTKTVPFSEVGLPERRPWLRNKEGQYRTKIEPGVGYVREYTLSPEGRDSLAPVIQMMLGRAKDRSVMMEAIEHVERDRRNRGVLKDPYASAVYIATAVEKAYNRMMSASSEGDRRGGIQGNVIRQKFDVKIDLKSDTSPEGIAVAFRKAVDRATRKPTRSRRGLPLTPGPGATSR